MSSFRRRTLFLACTGAISVPLVAAALAWGCTAVATLALGSPSATAGGTVTVTGKFFGTHDPATDSSNGRAEIRLGSLTGPVLATAPPEGTSRGFTVQVTVPAGTPAGETFFTATQKTAAGTNVYGTPARQAFTVLDPPAPPTGGGSGGGGAGDPVATTVVPETVVDALTLADARAAAAMRVRNGNPGAKRVRANCSMRSATSATCRVRWTSKGKKRSTRLVITSQSAAAAAW